jgi:hypothetical protein
MPDDDSMLSQHTVDFRNEERRHANQGDGQLFTVPAKLTERQEFVLELVRSAGQMSALVAGVEIHKRLYDGGCRYCKAAFPAPCQYAESAGRQVLEALRKKGLLKRDRHHVYRLSEQPASTQVVAPPEDPADVFGY